MVLVAAPASVQITSGVPVTVHVIEPENTVPDVDDSVITPVPNEMAFGSVARVVNATALNVLLFRDSVPAVRTNWPFARAFKSSVVLTAKVRPPPGEFKLSWLKRSVIPAVFSV